MPLSPGRDKSTDIEKGRVGRKKSVRGVQLRMKNAGTLMPNGEVCALPHIIPLLLHTPLLPFY